VSFRHDLAARAVYEAFPSPGRRTAHQRAAEALEAAPQPPAARLARHFREAADVSKWSWYAEQAADAALAVGDEATAGDLLCVDVVRLAAAGHTNREIAAVLYRSPHTVAHQLKSAMRKLGVSSRAALADGLRMTGTSHAGGPDGGLPGPSQAVGGR
jgi:DNA-binding CsgD family transcriptional regulator